MSALTDNEIAICIASANWGPGPGSDQAAIHFLDVAIAVCRAESGGNPNAVSSTGDYGLWQINKAAHPEMFANNAPIMDSLANTFAAKAVYSGAGWKAWTAYKDGSYKSHLGAGRSAYAWLKDGSQDHLSTLNSASAKSGSGLKWKSENGHMVADVANSSPGIGGFGLGTALGALLSPVFGPGAIGMGAALGTGLPQTVTGNVIDYAKSHNPLDMWNEIWNKVYEGAKTVGVFLLALVIGVIGLVFLLRNTSAGQAVTEKVKGAGKDAAMAAVLA